MGGSGNNWEVEGFLRFCKGFPRFLKAGKWKILIFHCFVKVFESWELENIDFSLVFQGF